MPTDDSNFSTDPFFAAAPRALVEAGKFVQVPLFIGMTKDEGLMKMVKIMRDTSVRNLYWSVLAELVLSSKDLYFN